MKYTINHEPGFLGMWLRTPWASRCTVCRQHTEDDFFNGVERHGSWLEALYWCLTHSKTLWHQIYVEMEEAA